MFIVYFLLWTLAIYAIHRIIHVYGYYLPWAYTAHMDHHKYINEYGVNWHWNNLLLYNDTWLSTIDLWITEVIPTILFCAITGQWWILIAYYIWAAFVQEHIEHNPRFDFYPYITSGRWHLIHHTNSYRNYGLFLPIWDIIFGTFSNIKQEK